jgi:DNA polymerase
LRGEPFVGPAGKVLREVAADAGLEWDQLYVTNAVKHFHWEPRGKRRMHKRPPWRAVSACQDWLHAEAAAVAPRVIVCLGVTAALAVLGRDNRLTHARGRLLPTPLATHALVTWHPSAILRATHDHAAQLRADLTAHLKMASVAANP